MPPGVDGNIRRSTARTNNWTAPTAGEEIKARVALSRDEDTIRGENFDPVEPAASAVTDRAERPASRCPSSDHGIAAVGDDYEAASCGVPCNTVGTSEGWILKGNRDVSTGYPVDQVGPGVGYIECVGTCSNVVEETALECREISRCERRSSTAVKPAHSVGIHYPERIADDGHSARCVQCKRS